MNMSEDEYNFELIKTTPYLTLTGELWGVCWEDFGEKYCAIMALHCIVTNVFILDHGH